MAENSKIEWTNHTVNLWWGCTKVHAGCDHCYAETIAHHWGDDVWGNDKSRRMINSAFSDLHKYQRLAVEAGEIHRVFIGSMMDIFEKPMPMVDKQGNPVDMGLLTIRPLTGLLRFNLFAIVDLLPNLLLLLLTKRPSNINKMILEKWIKDPPPNIMYGTSPCDQETFDTLWPQLARVNGRRFLSVEPMLGPVQLKSYCPYCEKMLLGSLSPTCGSCHTPTIRPDWVICGGESGHGKRPMNVDWARDLRDQCEAARVPFFMKQIDKVQPIPDDLMIRQFPK